MIIIKTKPYILLITIQILNFYFIFFFLGKNYRKKKYIKIAICSLPFYLLGISVSNIADFLIIIINSILMKTNKKEDNILLFNTLLYSMIVNHIIIVLSSLIMTVITITYEKKGYFFVFFQILIIFCLSLLFFWIVKKFNWQNKLKQNTSIEISFLLLYFYIVSSLLIFVSNYYGAFQVLISGITVFLILQIVFLIILFTRINKKNYAESQKISEKKELENLKKYTLQLESEQRRLLKFKHDYKNILFSLKESAEDNNEAFLNQLTSLETYSSHYIDSSNINFNQYDKIKNSNVKSLLISKAYQIKQYNLSYNFECINPVDLIPIPIFDCIRIFGILIDNAIEAASLTKLRKLSIMLYQDESQLEFIVENSYQDMDIPISYLKKSGFSTKENHSGIGLSTIDEIKKTHKNMFVQFNKTDGFFSVQVIFLKKQDGG